MQSEFCWQAAERRRERVLFWGSEGWRRLEALWLSLVSVKWKQLWGEAVLWGDCCGDLTAAITKLKVYLEIIPNTGGINDKLSCSPVAVGACCPDNTDTGGCWENTTVALRLYHTQMNQNAAVEILRSLQVYRKVDTISLSVLQTIKLPFQWSLMLNVLL